MKKNLKFLLLAPCLMAILCEDATDDCGLAAPEILYTLNVENATEIYLEDEVIVLNAQTTSMLVDPCNNSSEPELVIDAEEFIGGFFLLKLNNDLVGLNAEVYEDFTVQYSLGETYNNSNCIAAIRSLPVLSDDNQTYNYNLDLSISSPGDYCMVNTFGNNFNLENDNNAQVFEPYNNLGNKIKFEDCGDIYTRTGLEGHYFFRVE